MTCIVVAFVTSVIKADILDIEKDFDFSKELTLASISLFVVGFRLGMARNQKKRWAYMAEADF